MALYEFFTSRNNSANAASFVGQAGRLFYDGDNGVVKLSDGTTPGGTFIPYNIATDSTIGGIKAGPGANVSVDGTLTIDTTGLPLSIGNLNISGANISAVNTNENLNLLSNGTGEINLIGNIHIHPYDTWPANDSTPVFQVINDGTTIIRAPSNLTTKNGLLINASGSDAIQNPQLNGATLHTVGNNGTRNLFLLDAAGNVASYPSIVFRQSRNTAANPTSSQNGDVLGKISSVGHDDTGYVAGGGVAPASIDFIATENFSATNGGTKIGIYASANGSNLRTLSATFTNQGMTGNIYSNVATVTGNLTVSGYTTGRWLRTTRNAGVIADGGTLTIDFSTDAIVYCTWANGMTLAYTNYLPGRIVKVMCAKASGSGTDTLNLDGVTASQVSSGSTTINAAADTTTFIELTSTNTSIGGVFVKL